ncbi:MAG: response regulator [Planctomycetes bacterium]|nr:response regulator [Planctomycetota bacterium]
MPAMRGSKYTECPFAGAKGKRIMPTRNAPRRETPMTEPQPPRFRVLVVDDNRTTLDLMREFFSVIHDYRVEVTVATGGKEALDRVRAEPFDLVFTDVMMPGMDGFDLLSRLVKERPGLRVVAMTAYDDVFRAQKARDLGAFEFLQKPFTVAELTRVLDRVRVEGS